MSQNNGADITQDDDLREKHRRVQRRTGTADTKLRRAKAFMNAVHSAQEAGEDLGPHIERVRDLIARQRRLDETLQEANGLQKEITNTVVPGMFYYLLSTAILITLCGFIIISYPSMRIYFIVSIGVIFVGFIVFYFLRMQRYRSEVGELQDRLFQVATQADEQVEEIGSIEEALRTSPFPLETDSYVEYEEVLGALERGENENLERLLGIAALEAEAARTHSELDRVSAEMEAVKPNAPAAES